MKPMKDALQPPNQTVDARQSLPVVLEPSTPRGRRIGRVTRALLGTVGAAGIGLVGAIPAVAAEAQFGGKSVRTDGKPIQSTGPGRIEFHVDQRPGADMIINTYGRGEPNTIEDVPGDGVSFIARPGEPTSSTAAYKERYVISADGPGVGDTADVADLVFHGNKTGPIDVFAQSRG